VPLAVCTSTVACPSQVMRVPFKFIMVPPHEVDRAVPAVSA
jgi:hypothetical protein